MHDIPHKNDMGSQRHSQQNSGTGHTAWLHQLPWAEMQGHGTGQSSIVKCNLTSRSLLVHHLAGLRRICKGSAKDLSVVSKTEPSQELNMRSPVIGVVLVQAVLHSDLSCTGFS